MLFLGLTKASNTLIIHLMAHTHIEIFDYRVYVLYKENNWSVSSFGLILGLKN